MRYRYRLELVAEESTKTSSTSVDNPSCAKCHRPEGLHRRWNEPSILEPAAPTFNLLEEKPPRKPVDVMLSP